MSTELFADVPDEPAIGSVVLDRTGVAIQRRKVSADTVTWVGADLTGVMLVLGTRCLDWPSILLARGPVRLIWDGATDAPPAAPDLETALRTEQAANRGRDPLADALAEPPAR